ncbi:PocR ligand-binding domain-containing protein [Parablautia sp. Marseille-Q6255]|uniref:PocR ligand-binding domain-containing protein n=1 Tax=Parablautia sp. Marseille-Q6255 TaxID=3039593 RepID=UPI0024BC4F3D|nr:AraC family transcriptional regulator [Parablautia sp. Marseille-Q6255]
MQPILYTVIQKQHLHDMLETFYHCINLPIQVLDENGNILDSFGDTYHYCRIFKGFLPKSESCQKIHSNASKLAMSLGETYIFACHSNLNHIVFPLTNHNTLLGSILAGPFLMDEPDSLLLSDLSRKYQIPAISLLEMYEEAGKLPVIDPPRVTYISRLLYFMCSGLVTDSRNQFILNQSKLHQQSVINESIQTYKAASDINKKAYPYEKEKALITKLKTGDTEQAKALLNDLLGYVFFAEGTDLNIVKSRAIELSSLLSRAAIEGGATSDSILRANNQFLMDIQNTDTLDDLCYRLQETIDVFTECMFNYIPSKGSELIKKAIRYISKNFQHTLTLDEVASHVHLNPSYFSTLFKQSTGSSFKEYLNLVRIEESKRLLANTDYSIIDISIAVGFEDQSYFSKVFKKYTGLTPKQYR